MPKLTIEYTVPVVALVDTDTGAVERVVIFDEDVRLARRSTRGGDRLVVKDPETRKNVAVEDEKAVAAIAERAEWPAWEFGA